MLCLGSSPATECYFHACGVYLAVPSLMSRTTEPDHRQILRQPRVSALERAAGIGSSGPGYLPGQESAVG